MTTTAAGAFYTKPQSKIAIKAPRIEVVDALRGFAIFAIMILHNLEHFDLFYKPEQLPGWMKTLDSKIWDIVTFLFAGKAYAIFALLFGFTFFIQMQNQAKKGIDFRLRFLWRLFLLFIFGCINALFYEGDILSLYAILGIALVPVGKWSNRALFITAIFLALQPYEWYNVFQILNNPDYIPPNKLYSPLFAKAKDYMKGESFMGLVEGNFLYGRPGTWFWCWEKGRFFQTISLFILGVLLGRQGRFVSSVQNAQFWKKILLIAIVLFIPLFYFKGAMNQFFASEVLAKKLSMIVTTWSNMAFMFVLTAFFAYLYMKGAARKALNIFAPLGRMSITNYIVQSIMGSFIYYGYGLGLYQYTGFTYSLLIGLGLFVLQYFFCRWWLSKHKQGPLESLWHRTTWIGRAK